MSEYPGVYRSDEATIEIIGRNSSVSFVHSVPEGGTEEANLVGIGEDLFMAKDGVRSQGTLAFFVRNNEGEVNSVLVGGQQHWLQ